MDKAWISDVATLLKKGEIDTNGVTTWDGFNSQCMRICQTSIVISILCGHRTVDIVMQCFQT